MNNPNRYANISRIVISKKAVKHEKMLNTTLKWMNSELDIYIGEMYEVPFFFNERSVLGFFISGLTRNSNTIVLQEFSCFKNRKQNQKKILGRADLYFYFDKVSYLIESKWCWSRYNKRSQIKQAFKRAKKALDQVSGYTKDAKVSKKNIFSLCFETIGFTKNELIKNYEENISAWKIKQRSDLSGLDFYALIEITANVKRKWYFYDDSDQLYFPVLAVYGVLNR